MKFALYNQNNEKCMWSDENGNTYLRNFKSVTLTNEDYEIIELKNVIIG